MKLAIRFQLHNKVSVVILLIVFFQEVFYLGQNVKQFYDSSEVPSAAICNL